MCCGNCRSAVEEWLFGTRKSLPFAIPRIWREPTNHHNDYYFCMIDIKKYKDRRHLKYPSLPVYISPVPHSDNLSLPSPPEESSYEEERKRTSDPNESFSDEDAGNGRHLLNQEKLEDLIRELQLRKSKGEFIASRLKKWRHQVVVTENKLLRLSMGYLWRF